MSQWRDRLGPWLLPVLAAAALGISAGALYQLMVRFGWPAWQAALLPLCVDVVALYGVYLWLSNAKGGEAWRFGRKVAYAALVVSLAGNALEHGLSSAGWYTLGAILFGSVPPVALFVMVHAYFKVRTTRPRPKPEPAAPSPSVSRNPTPPAPVVQRKTPRPPATTGTLPTPHPAAVQRFKELAAEQDGKPPSRAVFKAIAQGEGWPTSTKNHQAVRAAALNGHTT